MTDHKKLRSDRSKRERQTETLEAEPKSQSVHVDVGGVKLTLTVDENRKAVDINEIAAYLDAKIEDLTKANPLFSTEKKLAATALNVAAEFHELRKRHDEFRLQVNAQIERAIEMIEHLEAQLHDDIEAVEAKYRAQVKEIVEEDQSSETTHLDTNTTPPTPVTPRVPPSHVTETRRKTTKTFEFE